MRFLKRTVELLGMPRIAHLSLVSGEQHLCRVVVAAHVPAAVPVGGEACEAWLSECVCMVPVVRVAKVDGLLSLAAAIKHPSYPVDGRHSSIAMSGVY